MKLVRGIAAAILLAASLTAACAIPAEAKTAVGNRTTVVCPDAVRVFANIAPDLTLYTTKIGTCGGEDTSCVLVTKRLPDWPKASILGDSCPTKPFWWSVPVLGA